MMRTRALGAMIVVSLLLLGCRGAAAPVLGMSDSTFVATLGELSRADGDTSLDATMKDSTRRLILRRHRVTTTLLEAAARALASNPAHASDLWRQVESPPRAQGPAPRSNQVMPHP